MKNERAVLLHHPCILEETEKWFKKEYGYNLEEGDVDISPPDYQIDDPKYRFDPLNDFIFELSEKMRLRRLQGETALTTAIDTLRPVEEEVETVEGELVSEREEVTRGIFEDLREHIRVDPILSSNTIALVGDTTTAIANLDTREIVVVKNNNEVDEGLKKVWGDMDDR